MNCNKYEKNQGKFEEKVESSISFESVNQNANETISGRKDNDSYSMYGTFNYDDCVYMTPQKGQVDVCDVLELIKRRYRVWFKDVDVYKMHIHDNYGDYYFIDLDKHVIIHCTKKFFEYKLRKLNSKVINYKGNLIMVCTSKTNFSAEALEFLFGIPRFLHSMKDYIGRFSDVGRKCIALLNNNELKIILVDLISFMVNIRDGYFTFSKVLTTLLSIFTLSTRITKCVTNTFAPQDLGINDLILGFSVFGVSESILSRLKTFMALSGKKLHDCSGLVNLVSEGCNLLISLIDSIIEAHPMLSFLSVISTTCKSIMSYFLLHTSMKQLVDIHTKYVKNSQIMFDPIFRHDAITLYERLAMDVAFMEFIKSPSNRYLLAIWESYYNNIVKYARSYACSSRVEPICIVFEGEANSGKSRLMNAVADVLRKADYSTYVHIVPPINSSKDYYDDYINQDVFIMDDVGQQGVSQWRTIINFVSPVKTPLDCAAQELKNTKFFNSKILLVTTNALRSLHAFTANDCISTPEALFRRCHVVDVRRGVGNHFTQTLKYYKYSVNSHSWENEFLYENADCNMPVSLDNVTQRNAVKWVFNTIKTLEHLRTINDNVCEMSDEDIDDIISTASIRVKDNVVDHTAFFDAQDYPRETTIRVDVMDNARDEIWRDDFPTDVVNGPIYTAGWMEYIVGSVNDLVSRAWQEVMKVFNNISAMEDSSKAICIAVAAAGIVTLGHYFIYTLLSDTHVNVGAETTDKWRNIVSKFKAEVEEKHRELTKSVPENVLNVQKYVKLVVNSGTGSIGHCVVSGNNLLIPNHYAWDGAFVDIYSSWDHYDHKHKEAEQVQIKLVKSFNTVDLAVYAFIDFPLLYKKCRTLFTESNTHDPTVYAIFPGEICKLVRGFNVRENEFAISYSKNGPVTHNRQSGYLTPLSSNGFCGMVLTDVQGNILSMHVAGNGTEGFTVVPPYYIKEEISSLMLRGNECNLALDSKIIPGFSGARLRYDEGQVDKKYPIAKTNFVPSPLHIDYCEDMAQIVEELRVDIKGPPIIDKPIAKLKELAMKTFSHQGIISDSEHDMLHTYMMKIIPEFQEISWDQVAFGDEEIPPLNKKSSNGYGMKASKLDYIDYQNRVISPELMSKLNVFKDKSDSEEDIMLDTLCVETFKDELRASEKRDNPRTFRVIPLVHIMWTKKLFGNLIKYYKDNIHTTGICVGFNPYKDFDILARKLKKAKVLCDADFKKWDGTLNARIMKIIAQVFAARYRGCNRKVLQSIMSTIINSTVLVNDAVYRTTHGLPSGTWLTLLLNCLYNKALTALTIYRNGGSPMDDSNIIDYVTGDDKICGSDRNYGHIFNALTIKNVAESLGMTCTNGDKTPIVSASTSFDKLNYLKRSFVYNSTLKRWMGALSIDTIVNTLQWYDRTKDFDIVMEGKCRSMQIELWLHPPFIYNSIMSIISNKFPHISLFEEDEIIRILNSDNGYREVCEMSGKDISWL